MSVENYRRNCWKFLWYEAHVGWEFRPQSMELNILIELMAIELPWVVRTFLQWSIQSMRSAKKTHSKQADEENSENLVKSSNSSIIQWHTHYKHIQNAAKSFHEWLQITNYFSLIFQSLYFNYINIPRNASERRRRKACCAVNFRASEEGERGESTLHWLRNRSMRNR